MREVPDKYKRLQKDWWKLKSLWGRVHFVLGLSATTLAFLASSKELSTLIQDPKTAAILSLASGLLVVILTFLSPASRRKGYTEACDLLRVTRLRYEREENYADRDLNDAVEKAQQIIARS
jgi:hypothetical protein